MKKYAAVLAAGFLALLVVPVLVAQLTKSETRRRFQGGELDGSD